MSPIIGDKVRFQRIAPPELAGTLWGGQIVDIREAPSDVGEWMPDPSIRGYWRLEPAYPAGTRLAFIASLGWPELLCVPLTIFTKKRRGAWESAAYQIAVRRPAEEP